MAVGGFISYWWLPILSGTTWLGTLLGMLLWWIVTVDRRPLPTVDPGMTLPYISDIGALELKPLFIAGSAVTTVTFSLAFAAERWLRHRGRLVPNGSVFEKVLSVLSIILAIVGTAGLILLSVFDTWRHPTLHNSFLAVFLAGYLLSAVCICWEHQRLETRHREFPYLRTSFYIKLFFIVVELALAIAFGVTTGLDNRNVGAYLEWIIAFIFSFYVFSFIIDLWPARRTKPPSHRFSKTAGQYQMRDVEAADGFGNGSFVPGRNGAAPGHTTANF